jgi:hypothetical protein
VVGIGPDGQVDPCTLTREQIQLKNQQQKQKLRNSQAEVYFQKLQQHLKITPAANSSQFLRLEVVEFPLRIGYIDKLILECHKPILELKLNSAFLTSSECLVLAANSRMSDLRVLDLSCNPITATGLLNLVHPKRACFEKLSSLILYNCEIDCSQTYLISSENLEDCKCKYQLRELNLSHNRLSFFLNYVLEMELINPFLEKLSLSNCVIDDEQVLQLSDSGKLV